jgi:hypothetical protein
VAQAEDFRLGPVPQQGDDAAGIGAFELPLERRPVGFDRALPGAAAAKSGEAGAHGVGRTEVESVEIVPIEPDPAVRVGTVEAPVEAIVAGYHRNPSSAVVLPNSRESGASQKPARGTLGDGCKVVHSGAMDEPLPPARDSNFRAHRIAKICLVLALVALGLWINHEFLPALVWAAILGIATGPLYRRIQMKHERFRSGALLPGLFTLAFAVMVIAPIALALVEAARESHQAAAWIASARANGVPTPAWIAHLPFGSA